MHSTFAAPQAARWGCGRGFAVWLVWMVRRVEVREVVEVVVVVAAASLSPPSCHPQWVVPTTWSRCEEEQLQVDAVSLTYGRVATRRLTFHPHTCGCDAACCYCGFKQSPSATPSTAAVHPQQRGWEHCDLISEVTSSTIQTTHQHNGAITSLGLIVSKSYASSSPTQLAPLPTVLPIKRGTTVLTRVVLLTHPPLQHTRWLPHRLQRPA